MWLKSLQFRQNFLRILLCNFQGIFQSLQRVQAIFHISMIGKEELRYSYSFREYRKLVFDINAYINALYIKSMHYVMHGYTFKHE